MMNDESTTRRYGQPASASQPEQAGWEERNNRPPGWEHRNDRKDRLREGNDHPLHHGRTLHGDHAFDGGERHEADAPLRSTQNPRGTDR